MIILPALAVAFAAVCVWLGVRVYNRRERWAKWTLAVVTIGLPAVYLASFGPACWLTAQPLENNLQCDGWNTPPRFMLIYWPFGITLNKTDSPMKTAIKWWATFGIGQSDAAVVPFGTGPYEWGVARRMRD